MKSIVTGWVVGIAAVSATSGSAVAGQMPSTTVGRGEQLSRLICSACHVVAADQEFPPLLRQPAPPFADIANRDGVSEKSLRHFITMTHWDEKTLPMSMPNPELTEEQTIAVSRYIMSLRRK